MGLLKFLLIPLKFIYSDSTDYFDSVLPLLHFQ